MNEPVSKDEVLVISTSPTLKALLELSIEEQGIQSAFFEKAQLGLNYLREVTPKVIVLDDMIDIDPFSITSRLKMSRRLREIPIILLIDANDQQAKLTAEIARVDYVVTKPIERRLFSTILRRVVNPDRSSPTEIPIL